MAAHILTWVIIFGAVIGLGLALRRVPQDKQSPVTIADAIIRPPERLYLSADAYFDLVRRSQREVRASLQKTREARASRGEDVRGDVVPIHAAMAVRGKQKRA